MLDAAQATAAAGWPAELALEIAPRAGRSICSARHRGPLRVQKALYPEGAALCHAIVLHPPGGIAGGDALTLDLRVAAGAQALLTTPGATKWYKANGRPSTQRLRFAIDGQCEWLPQEAIVFDAAQAHSSLTIELGADAAMIGWDLVALGRQAAGERFCAGRYAQDIRLTRAGELLWHERTRLAGGDPLLASPVGLHGRPVFGCLWAAGHGVEALDLDALRTAIGAATAAPPTRLHAQLVVARVLAPQAADARAALIALWSALRPALFGRAAQLPRIWAT